LVLDTSPLIIAAINIMNKTELLSAIFKGLPDGIDLPRKTLETIIRVMHDQIIKTLRIGHSVSLPGFGTFKVKSMPARKGRNPNTGEPIEIAAHRKVTFTSAKALKEKLNE